LCQIEFTVLLEASRALPTGAWEVSVWHNCPTKVGNEAKKWETLSLTRSAHKPFGLVSPSTPNVYHYSFTATLRLPQEFDAGALRNFTVKFRSGPNVPWQWVKDQFGISDGCLLIPRRIQDGAAPAWASTIFGDRHLQGWEITSLQSQAPGAALYSIESEDFIPRNSVDDSKYESKIFKSRILPLYGARKNMESMACTSAWRI
jgi:hypothetical protein